MSKYVRQHLNPNTVVHGIKTTIEIVKQYARLKGGKFLSNEYKNMLEKYQWECSLGHKFTATFNHIKNRNQWCPICGKEKSRATLYALMKTQEIRDKISKGHQRRNGFLTAEERLKKRSLKKKERFLHRLKTEPQERLKHNVRARIRMAIYASKAGKKISISKNMGCTWDEFTLYIESKFYSNSITGEIMTWNNYGKWHIDHIKPLSSFDLTQLGEQKSACHYTNLQPLWAKDNLVKSNKYEVENGKK